MGVVGTGQITLYDQNDTPTPLLSLDRCALPADASGAVTSFSAAVTTLSIFRGGIDESSLWAVSVVKSSGLNGTLAGKTFTVSSLSVDSGYVDFTATRAGFANLTKRFEVAKVRQGQTGNPGSPGSPGAPGAPAQTFFLKASLSAFEYYHWGVAKSGQSIILAIERTNLTDAVSWSASAGVVLPTGDLSKTLTPDNVTNAGDTFTITATCGSFSSTITLTKKRDAVPLSAHQGAVSAIPGTTGYVTGDTVLYVGAQTTDGNGLAWTPGNLYAFSEETAKWSMGNTAGNIARATKDIFAYADTIYAANPNADTMTYIKNLIASNASIAELAAQEIVMTADGIIRSSNYQENGSGVPTAGFKFAGSNGKIKAVLAELYQATLYGSLIHDALQTLDQQTGASVTFDSATRWFGGDLYNALSSIAVDGALATCAGSALGITVNQASRRSAAGDFKAVDFSGQSLDGTTYNYTVTVAGTYKFLCKHYGYYKNSILYGVTVADWSVNGALLFDGITEAGGVEVTRALNAGDTVSLYIHGWQKDTLWGDPYAITVTTTAKYSHPQCVIFANSATPFSVFYVPYQAFYTTAKSVAITSPNSYASGSNLLYSAGTNFVNAVSGFTPGVARAVTGSMTIDGTSRTVTALTYQGGGALITHSGGTKLVFSITAEGAADGFYKVSGSVTFLAQVASIATKHIVPKAGATYDIGADTNRFRDLFLSRALYLAGALSMAGGNISGVGQFAGASLSLSGAIAAASAALTGNFSCAVASPARVDCFAIDDDTAPLGTKTTGATAGITFVVYKPIHVRISAETDGPSVYLDVRYNAGYINILTTDYYTPKYVTLAPGNYKLRTSNANASVAIRCLGVYGANSASTFWS